MSSRSVTEIAGHASAYTRELTVPGASVPAAHVSLVSVEPTHHRRGLLRRLMTHQLETVDEPIAVLWASEGRIYQRFGYGMATKSAGLTVSVREVSLRAPRSAVGAVRAVLPAEARSLFPDVYERKRVDQPGLSSRGGQLVGRRPRRPRIRAAKGSRRKRFTVFDAGRGVEGYAIWRAKSAWTDAGPDGETKVLELIANTPEAYASCGVSCSASTWRGPSSPPRSRSTSPSCTWSTSPACSARRRPTGCGSA